MRGKKIVSSLTSDKVSLDVTDLALSIILPFLGYKLLRAIAHFKTA